MVKVRHKPTIGDAVRWTDTDAARAELEALGFLEDVGEFRYARQTHRRRALVLDDGRLALPGDWIIRGAQEWFGVAPSIFWDRFDVVERDGDGWVVAGEPTGGAS